MTKAEQTMNESKESKIVDFIEKRVNAALAECAISNPGSAEWLSKNRNWITQLVISRCTGTYDLVELSDIMAWKKPRRV